MPDDDQSEARLHKLARRLHQGWEKLHPVTEKELDAVRQAVRAQWEQEQKVGRQAAASAQTKKGKSAEQTQESKKTRSQGHTKPGTDKSDEHSH